MDQAFWRKENSWIVELSIFFPGATGSTWGKIEINTHRAARKIFESYFYYAFY